MKKCTIQSCDKPLLAKLLCSKHYYRLKRGQDVLGETRFTNRPAIEQDGLTLLRLGSNRGYAIIDKENSFFDKYNWSLDGRGYAHAYIKGKEAKLHHLVIGKPVFPLVTDHINRNKLDNRKENLRFVERKVNQINIDKPVTNKSGILGVHWDDSRRKWLAQIRIEDTQKFLGRFDTVEEATMVRQQAELQRQKLYSKK